jgi:hypothetical protein
MRVTVEQQQTTPPSSLADLAEEDRAAALARFQTIRPFLEDGVSLPQNS